jgi:hypothetical protein
MIGFDGLFLDANHGTFGKFKNGTLFTQNSSNILSPSPLKSWPNTKSIVKFNSNGTMELIRGRNIPIKTPTNIAVDKSLTPNVLSVGSGSNNNNNTFIKIFLTEQQQKNIITEQEQKKFLVEQKKNVITEYDENVASNYATQYCANRTDTNCIYRVKMFVLTHLDFLNNLLKDLTQ